MKNKKFGRMGNNKMNRNNNNNNNNNNNYQQRMGGGGGVNASRNNNIMNNNQNNYNRGYQNNYNRNRNNYNNNNNNNNYNRHHHYHPKPFIPHVLFDFIQTEHAFPRIKQPLPQEEKSLSDALLKRNQDLTPQSNDLTQLSNLMTNIQTVLDNLILTPGDFDACQIDEIKQVGSLKKGTLLASSKLVGDLCVVLKTLPTREAVNRLAAKVFEEVHKSISNQVELKNLQLEMNDKGFEISSIDFAVQVLVTTQHQNLRKLDTNLHLDPKLCYLNLASIKHARWFEENASHSTIKVLIRVLKDVKNRFEGLEPLNPWIIDLLAHHAVMNNPKKEPLPLIVAFRRIFQLISAGFFLPGSAGIIDPCEQAAIRVHTTLTLDQQDIVCYTCQTLLRILAHGGFRQIIGLEGNSTIATQPSIWSGVSVIPSSKAYEPIKEVEQQQLVPSLFASQSRSDANDDSLNATRDMAEVAENLQSVEIKLEETIKEANMEVA